MIKKLGQIKNPNGIHCRPSTVIAKTFKDYGGNIEITGPDGTTVTPRSSLSVMGLALNAGDMITVSVDGPDEEAVCDRVIQLFESNFDFPPR